MKKLLFILAIIVFPLSIFSSCSSQAEPDCPQSRSDLTFEQPDYSNDPLILELQALNDSLAATHNLIDAQQGLNISKKFFKIIKIICADVKGAYLGTKIANECNLTGFKKFIVVVCYAVYCSFEEARGTAFSNMSNLTDIFPGYQSQTNIENALAGAFIDESLVDQEINAASLKMGIPKAYNQSLSVGVDHNVTLNIILKNKEHKYRLSNVLSPEEIEILHSDEISCYFSFNMGIQNPQDNMETDNTREGRIINTFIDGLQSYPQNMDEVISLINVYCERIITDPDLTAQQCRSIFAALSTAGYSTSYWLRFFEEYDLGETETNR